MMLRFATTATEILMILYWIIAALLVLKIVHIDPELMYSDYQNPLVVAWNWSFFPIDIAFAVTGLVAKFGKTGNRERSKLETISATLMFCAGLMAISFWVLTNDFDLVWWSMNLWLIILGLLNLTN